MTRKDYILLAKTLNLSLQSARGFDAANGTTAQCGNNAAGVLLTAGRIANALAEDNLGFDSFHFLAVVRGERPLTSRPIRKPSTPFTKAMLRDLHNRNVRKVCDEANRNPVTA